MLFSLNSALIEFKVRIQGILEVPNHTLFILRNLFIHRRVVVFTFAVVEKTIHKRIPFENKDLRSFEIMFESLKIA